MTVEDFVTFCIDKYDFIPNSSDLKTFNTFAMIHSRYQKEPSENLVRCLIESNYMNKRNEPEDDEAYLKPVRKRK